MDTLTPQNQPNNPIDHESFTLPTQSKRTTRGKILIGGLIVLLVGIFFIGGMYLRSRFIEEKFETGQTPQAQVPAGFTFPTVNPPATPTSTANTIDSIEKDLNAIDLKTFEAEINNDLDNISKSL